MSFENPSQIIRSWGLTKNFAAGPTTVDKLVPPTYGKIRTPFVQTWREEKLGSSLDWDNGTGFSYYLPESLRVISSTDAMVSVVPPARWPAYRAGC